MTAGPGDGGTGASLAGVQAARAVIAPHVRLTPVWPSLTLERLCGVPVALKCENMQLTGSFKLRGATTVVARLAPEAAARGLVAASAGNHAQGLALAGTRAGLDVTVVMPVVAPLAKANAARGYGARVVLHGSSLEEAKEEALRIAADEGRLFVPPFDHDDVIEGQGTLGLEILEQVPDVAEVLVPAGGGGLLAGIALAVKATRPDVRVVGVQSAAMDGLCRSFAAGRVVATPAARTIADGVAVAGPSERTFALVRRHVDAMVECSDEAIARAMVLLIERSKLIVEGAGALAVAAIQSGAYRPRGKAVALLSGGNVDINVLGSIVRRGLVEAGRYQHLTIEVSDTPGELALITRAVADAGGNILEVDHNREAPGMPVGVALVDFLLEVNGLDHFNAVIAALREAGLRGVPGGAARLATHDARRRHEQ